MADIKQVFDDSALQTRLNDVIGRLDKPRPVMLEIAEELHRFSMLMFDQQGYPAGSWPDLLPSTKRSRAKRGHWPGKLLQISGRLISSIQIDAGKDYSQIGTNLIYAPVQHFGAKIKRRGNIRLRTNANGSLKRQANNENLAVFAKKTHKRAVERTVDYNIVIKPRPILPITPDGKLITPAFNDIMLVLDNAILK